MLQNAFDKRMQREAKTILEGHLEEANHLRHVNDVGGEKVKAPNPDTEGRSVARGEIMFKRGLDSTRAHNFGILYSRPQVSKATRIPDLTDLTLAFAMRGRGTRSRDTIDNNSRTTGALSYLP